MYWCVVGERSESVSPTFPKDGSGNVCVYISSFIHKKDYVVRDLAHELFGTSVTAQTKIKDNSPRNVILPVVP